MFLFSHNTVSCFLNEMFWGPSVVLFITNYVFTSCLLWFCNCSPQCLHIPLRLYSVFQAEWWFFFINIIIFLWFYQKRKWKKTTTKKLSKACVVLLSRPWHCCSISLFWNNAYCKNTNFCLGLGAFQKLYKKLNK